MTQTSSNSVASGATSSPDWSTQAEEIHCPLCEYNLRGLTEPRCPECGHEFEWARLLDPAQRVHSYLFEHHPKRNIWSFTQTTLGMLNPLRFWTSLHTGQPSKPRRLVLYWFMGAIVLIIPFTTFYVQACMQMNAQILASRQFLTNFVQQNPSQLARIIGPHQTVAAAMDAYNPLPPSPRFFLNVFRYSDQSAAIRTWALGYLCWPWISTAGLMLFQITLRRARIRVSHLLRCTIYSADIVPVFVAAAMIATAALFRQAHMFYFPAQLLGVLAIILLWLIPTLRLIAACRLYLRIPAPATTVLLTQVIYLLLLIDMAFAVFRIVYIERLFQVW